MNPTVAIKFRFDEVKRKAMIDGMIYGPGYPQGNHTVEVTQSHIDEWFDGGFEYPIEIAIKEQTPFGASFSFDGTSFTLWGLFSDSCLNSSFPDPKEIRVTYGRVIDFIKRCNSKKSVKPFIFTFQV